MSKGANSSGGRRILVGRVVSDKMDKTVTVEVTRRVKHRVYGKVQTRRKTYKAHDAENVCKMDDMVVIQESRPLSATKRWMVIERRTIAIATAEIAE